MDESYKLTYFNLKAVAEPIRMILAYAEVPYEDNRVEFSDWPDVKDSYPWGVLPTLQVGNEILCQSNAIGRYLAKKYDLLGETEWEAAKIDELVDVLVDFRKAHQKPNAAHDDAKKEELKQAFIETVAPSYLSKLDAIAAANEGPFMVGKKLSLIDIQMAHLVDWFSGWEPSIDWDAYPNLQQLKDTVFEVPQIKAHIETRPDTRM